MRFRLLLRIAWIGALLCQAFTTCAADPPRAWCDRDGQVLATGMLLDVQGDRVLVLDNGQKKSLIFHDLR